MTAARLAARAMLRYPAWWGMWTCAVVALVYTAISVVVATWGTPGTATSVWSSVGWVLQWAAFAGGIAVGACIPVLVAHGLSRRSTAAAGALAVFTLAGGLAVLVQVGLAAEWLIYRAGGLPYLLDGAHLFRTIGEVHLVLAEHTLNFGSFLVSGLLIFAAYYRLGAWRGTLVLPLTLLPPAGALTALSAGSVGPDSSPLAGTIGRSLALALALVVVAAGLLAVHALTRVMPIKTR